MAAIILIALVGTQGTIGFLAYFTALANLFAAILMAGQSLSPRWMDSNGPIRGAITLYMVASAFGVSGPWSDFVLHTLGPVTVLIDWLLFPPPRPLGRAILAWWLVAPAAYLAATLVRGAMTGFYPYSFLDPRNTGGYTAVVASVAVAGATLVAIGAVLRWWSNHPHVSGRE